MQSRPLWIGLIAGFSAFLLLGGFDPVRAEALRMGGTGSGLELLRKLGEAYIADRPDVTVEIVPSLGTSGGLTALAEGAIDLAVAARPLKAEEVEKGLQELASTRTPFVLVTSRQDPEPLRAADVTAAFGNPQPTWSDGEPLRIVLRPESESDSRLLLEFFPGMAEALQKARSRPEIPVAATDQDSANTAEELKGSLAAATLVQIVSERRELRPIAIDGVEPTLESFEAGRYPYGKTLRFVVSQTPSAAAQGFIGFLTSEGAASIMRESGALPAEVSPAGL